MEIYIKDSDGKLQQTTLHYLLKKAFKKVGFKVDSGSLSDGSCDWVGVVQERNNNQVTTNIEFDDNQNTITGVSVYSAPIKRIIDEDNSKQIV